MSHVSVIASLKALTNLDLLDVNPTKQAKHLVRESDRTSIILSAALLEDHILKWLQGKMQKLNGEEMARIFSYEGPCGSFSNRIRMAQGLGLFDRTTRKRIELIKEMRNAAAHSHSPINFGKPQMRQAVAHLFRPEAREEVLGWKRNKLRATFMTYCIKLAFEFTGGDPFDADDFFEWVRHQEAVTRTSRSKSSGASRRARPQSA